MVVGVLVVVVEGRGAVETEKRGWEVGGTEEDGEEGEIVAAVKRDRFFQLEPTQT